eukprot:EG_transcript_30974
MAAMGVAPDAWAVMQRWRTAPDPARTISAQCLRRSVGGDVRLRGTAAVARDPPAEVQVAARLVGAQPVVLHHLERPVLGLGGQVAVGRLQGPGRLAAVARVPPREVQVAARRAGPVPGPLAPGA